VLMSKRDIQASERCVSGSCRGRHPFQRLAVLKWGVAPHLRFTWRVCDVRCRSRNVIWHCALHISLLRTDFSLFSAFGSLYLCSPHHSCRPSGPETPYVVPSHRRPPPATSKWYQAGSAPVYRLWPRVSKEQAHLTLD
jgi:hypothetical protein